MGVQTPPRCSSNSSIASHVSNTIIKVVSHTKDKATAVVQRALPSWRPKTNHKIIQPSSSSRSKAGSSKHIRCIETDKDVDEDLGANDVTSASDNVEHPMELNSNKDEDADIEIDNDDNDDKSRGGCPDEQTP
ncbi:hypothetical protein AAF712_015344 [Marasmius tenuissimus]|uniref:Uncharacterized protein n=1 Tax=Marasmius tenuissimus TaxID=585030 RepID=A0ABR2Z9K8_9AGAR